MHKQTESDVSIDSTKHDPHRELIDYIPDLICKWLPDGTLTFANDAYCRYFGKPLNELIGKTCLDYIHPDDQEKLLQHIAKLKSRSSICDDRIKDHKFRR